MIFTFLLFKICDFRDRLIGCSFFGYFFIVNDNFCMKNILFNTFFKIVRNRSNKNTLREVADF